MEYNCDDCRADCAQVQEALCHKSHIETAKQLQDEKEQLKKENTGLLKLTELLDEHPEAYEGPCLCKLCISYG